MIDYLFGALSAYVTMFVFWGYRAQHRPKRGYQAEVRSYEVIHMFKKEQ